MKGQPMLQRQPPSKIDALTGLRFFAALAVFLSHLPQPAYLPNWLSTFFQAGYNGVTIFFVLSGFVIGINYFEPLSRPTARQLLSYTLARLARVYPLYLFVLLYVWMEQGAPQNRDLLLHVLALQTWSSDLSVAFGLNSPGWSVGVEFFLYACFPIIAIAFYPIQRKRRLLWLLALGVMMTMTAAALYFLFSGRAALPITNPESAHRWLYRTPITRLGDFVLGIIAALLFRDRLKSEARAGWNWNLLSYASVIAIALLMLWPANLLSAFSWDVSYAPLAFLLIIGLSFAPQTLLGRFLGSPCVVLLGEASFALYLIHVPLIRIFGISRYTSFEPWIAIPLWFAFGAVCVAVAASLHRYVESPIRHKIKNWADKLTNMQRATSDLHDPIL